MLLCADEAACGVFPVLPFLPFFYGAGHTTLFSPAASDLGAHHPPVRQETAEGDPPPRTNVKFSQFAPPVLACLRPPCCPLSFFFVCAHFNLANNKQKKRDDKQPPNHHPALIPQKGAGLFSTNTKTNRALLPPPPVPVAVFRIGRRKMPLSGMRPFYATERREKNHPEEAEASVFYTNCAILAAPRFLPATPSQPHLCVSPAKFPLHTPEGAPPPARYFRLALSLFSPSRFRSRRGIKTFAPFGLCLRPTFMVGTQEKRGAPHLFRLGLHRATAQRPRPKTNAHSPFAGFLLLMNCCRRRESAQMRPPVPC